uniref:Uncharacterized protein n=1 Tax=Glossina austeni TaxID=7395 RepID=A0A1A9VSC1_GLOAU
MKSNLVQIITELVMPFTSNFENLVTFQGRKGIVAKKFNMPLLCERFCTGDIDGDVVGVVGVVGVAAVISTWALKSSNEANDIELSSNDTELRGVKDRRESLRNDENR